MDLEALERLGRLKESGVLTDEEFDAQKQRLLSSAEQSESSQTGDWDEPPVRNSSRTLLIVGLVVAALSAFGLFAYWREGHQPSSIEQSPHNAVNGQAALPRATAPKPNRKNGKADFTDYPAEVFAGPLRFPAEEEWPTGNWSEYRSQKVNFGGHFTFTPIGCGTECTSDWIVDRTDGRMIRGPEGQSDAQSLTVDTRANSNLMKVIWISSKNDGSGETYPPCFSQNFVWTGQGFHPLSKRGEANCPEES